MSFTEQYGGVPESGGNAVDNAIGCTNAVQSAGYHFGGENIGGNPNVVSGGTDPTSINFDGGATSNPLSNMNGGGKKRKARRSRKLKRSNKSRLNSKSKKSRSKSIRKSKKVRKTLSKRRVSLKRKSNKKRSKRSKRSRKSLK